MAIVAGQIGLPAYDMITAISGGTITLASPVTGTQTTPTSINFSKDNGGSVVRDNETTPVCYNRTTWNYSPREWGAHIDGSTDDTVPIQNWINAAQPHIAGPGNAVIDYGLTCSNPFMLPNYNGTIEGPPPAATSGGAQTMPGFVITAGDVVGGAFTGSAMLTMAAPVAQSPQPD
jgi:hypothetical protein